MDAEELIEMISDDNLFVDVEEQVLHAVLRWFSTDETQRKPALDQVSGNFASYRSRLFTCMLRIGTWQT